MPKLGVIHWFAGRETPEALAQSNWRPGEVEEMPEVVRAVLLACAGEDATLGTIDLLQGGENRGRHWCAVPSKPATRLEAGWAGTVAILPIEEKCNVNVLWVPRSEGEKERKLREEFEAKFKSLLEALDPDTEPGQRGGPIYGCSSLAPGELAKRVIELEETWRSALVQDGPGQTLTLSEAVGALRRVLKGVKKP